MFKGMSQNQSPNHPPQKKTSEMFGSKETTAPTFKANDFD